MYFLKHSFPGAKFEPCGQQGGALSIVNTLGDRHGRAHVTTRRHMHTNSAELAWAPTALSSCARTLRRACPPPPPFAARAPLEVSNARPPDRIQGDIESSTPERRGASAGPESESARDSNKQRLGGKRDAGFQINSRGAYCSVRGWKLLEAKTYLMTSSTTLTPISI